MCSTNAASLPRTAIHHPSEYGCTPSGKTPQSDLRPCVRDCCPARWAEHPARVQAGRARPPEAIAAPGSPVRRRSRSCSRIAGSSGTPGGARRARPGHVEPDRLARLPGGWKSRPGRANARFLVREWLLRRIRRRCRPYERAKRGRPDGGRSAPARVVGASRPVASTVSGQTRCRAPKLRASAVDVRRVEVG
jgi:hypothetical protein